jgi:hypothetical protein
MKPAVALIVVGGLVILGTLASAGFSRERDHQRVAEFYTRNGNAMILPADLRPGIVSFAEVCGFGIGGVMVLVGIWQSRAGAAQTPNQSLQQTGGA